MKLARRAWIMAAALVALTASFAAAGTASALESVQDTVVITDGTNWGFCMGQGEITGETNWTPSAPLDEITDVTVSIDAFDVDSDGDSTTGPEVDEVYLNGVLLGELEGEDQGESTTVFNLTASQIEDAFAGGPDFVITVLVDSDVNGGGWCVRVTRAEVEITFDAAVPSAEDECKQGGWEDLFDADGNAFKNQGDCVSYVATGGTNTAAGD